MNRPPPFSGRTGRSRITSLGVSARDDDDYQGGRGGGRAGRGKYKKPLNANYMSARSDHSGISDDNLPQQLLQQKQDDLLEEKMGYPLFKDGGEQLGWLLTYTTTSCEDKDTGQVVSAIDAYFQCQDGSMFKARVPFAPYFYLVIKDDMEREVEGYLRRKFETRIKEVEVVYKEDLDLKNHLSGLRRKLMKVAFHNVNQLMDVKKEVMPIIARNKKKADLRSAYDVINQDSEGKGRAMQDVLDSIVDAREYDVPYHVRFAIDTDLRCGHWYMVRVQDGLVSLEHRKDLLQRAEPKIMAFDIETTKLPLQFPNAEYDQIFMISYMVDRQGYLLVNREVVGDNIVNFEYTPKPEYEGPFIVINEPNEISLLKRWFEHVRQVKPGVMVTYNGDFFDFPFIEKRAEKNGMNMYEEMGFRMKGTECLSRSTVHMDCMHWVNRDSYLPQGSRGLKAVTKAKLGYDPVEVAPEDMVRLARDEPQMMASYSVSDAVATYYLYMTYVHPFIFSLATIIPLPPDEVLRKGSGTLCEQLLMVEAFHKNIICPNKHTAQEEVMYKGHLLESETYIGGKVEALESGVFRSDLPCRFKMKPQGYQFLIDKLEKDLSYAIETDFKSKKEDVVNFDEVKDKITSKLQELRDCPNREEVPMIYHLDVAAMYPNIILTNRLQPPAIVTDEDCAACDFNKPGKTCLRPMTWVWRGEHYSATRNEYLHLKTQLQSESFPPVAPEEGARYWEDLEAAEKAKLLKDRLKKYCQKVYKRVLDKPVREERVAGICQRENSFYVDTVRAFRDRRYEYKRLNKEWKGKLDEAKAAGNPIKIQHAVDMGVLYDSLQLAHKCILNSFYGYVMRKGARWYSMEMAGVVTHTGANIIQTACRLIEQLGRPLELDTDGIWCCLPGSFPENYKLKLKNGKELKLSYPCVMLNVLVAENNTNDQYQTLVDPEKKIYETSKEMSIEFEVDGPYKAMILPASKEEGKLIKKRYAVFNLDGTLAELKGFEIKRRGELKLIKVFQAEVFEQFLAGSTLRECYEAVAAVANRWLDLLDTQGTDLTDDELIDYISEATTMSKGMDEYEGRKSCAITTANRLAQFLGDERIKDKGLNCQYIIAKKPENQPTSARAIPVSIFSADPNVARNYLRKWCGDIEGEPGTAPEVRTIVDWDYYRERLGNAIQKIITIPAAMQGVDNPVPRIRHPDWLFKKVRERDAKAKQTTLDLGMFRQTSKENGLVADREQEEMEGSGEEDASEGERSRGMDNEETGAMDVDLEDLGKTACKAGDHKRGQPTVALAKRRSSGGKRELEVDVRDDQENQGPEGDAPLQQKVPNRHEDYKGWVAHQKRKWREVRHERKKRKLELSRKKPGTGELEQQQAQAAAPARNVGEFLRKHQTSVTHSHWQILQLVATSTPGTYKCWVVVDQGLYAIPVRIPRCFYVNSKLPPDNPATQALGRRVKKTLPYGATARHLYQVVMEEGDYRAHASRLASQLLMAEVEGVYEHGIPLDLQAALQLGCVVTVAPEARSRALGEGFELTQLLMKTTTECPYLEGDGPEGLGPMRYVVLFHSSDPAHGKGVYCLLLPALQRGLIVMMQPSTAAAREVTHSILERSWREATTALANQDHNTQEQVESLTGVEFSVEYVVDSFDAARLVQRALVQYREVHRGPVTLVCQAPQSSARLQYDIPILNDFPCVDIPHHSDDSRYPILQWQQRAARRALYRVAMAGGWLREKVALTRYAHVPLAHLGGDHNLAIADMLFARNLRDADHLLWCLDPSLPDLGYGMDTGRSEDTYLGDDDGLMTQIINPGAYRSITVELKLHHLAVCALDKVAQLAEIEGTADITSPGTGLSFKVLQSLVKAWLADATVHSNYIADQLLLNLYRWMSNPSSKLHDPQLHKALCRLMQKLFLLLVAEMRKLGATLVYADYGTILLCTGKRSVHAAAGYLRYLLEALKRRELFSWIELVPQKWWHSLLYRDPHNWGGLEASVSPDIMDKASTDSEREGQEGQEAKDEESEPRVVRDHWNLKAFLPPALQDHLVVVLTEFLYKPWKEAGRLVVTAGASQGGTQAVNDTKVAEEAQEAFLREWLSGPLTEKLLRKVQDMDRYVTLTSGKEENLYPQLAGSHLTEAELGPPAVCFVRWLCALLAVDQRLADEVGLLKRKLLKMLRIGEFSSVATFKEPCISFVLRDAICSFCNDCRDLDLCRDADLMEHQWKCRACSQPYDLDVIEARLVHQLHLKVRDYQLQDLVCMKCRQVASGHLNHLCSLCNGQLRNSIRPDTFQKQVVVFRNLARYHAFTLLQQLADCLLHDGEAPETAEE